MLRKVVFVMLCAVLGGAPVLGVEAAPVAASAPAAAASVQTPTEVVQTIANELAAAIDGHRKKFAHDKPALIKAIDGIFLPHFDVDFASILVLGRHARSATPEQRARFAKAFYDSLVNRYAEGLLNYTKGAVQVLPARGPLDARRSIVRTVVKMDNGKQLSVDYAFRKGSDGTWKAYDVIIEGISYIANYRNQVDAEIRKEGLNALIHNLETQGDKALQQMQKDAGSGHS